MLHLPQQLLIVEVVEVLCSSKQAVHPLYPVHLQHGPFYVL